MRKSFKYLLTLGIIALAPLSAKAMDMKVRFECPDTALAGAEISCKVSVTSSDVTLGGMNANYTLGTGITYVGFTPSYGYPVNTNKDTGFAVGDTAGFQKSEIATVKFKLPSNAASNSNHTITLTRIGLSDTEYNDYDLDPITETIRIKSSNNDLTSLNVTGATLNFNKTTKKYDLTIDAAKTTISVKAEDDRATVSGTGEKTLKYGLNTFEVKVTSEAGTVNTYTLNITRPDNRSTDKDILKFAFNDYTLDFKKDTTTYSLTVENNISKLYECTKNIKSDKYLCINFDDFDYNGEEFIYKLNGVEIDSLDIYWNAYDNGQEKCENKVCSYSINGEVLIVYNEETDVESFNLPLGDLKVGLNKLEVVITAENETTKTYTFNITRKEAEKEVVDKEETDKPEDSKDNPTVDKEETPEKNPGTGLFTGVGVVVFISLISVGLYFFMRRKNKFPQA